MNKLTLAMLVLLTLAGCDPQTYPRPDQCLRSELFQQCLQQLPAGPEVTKYNDWDEVVSQCENAAYNQSLRIKKTIKPECSM